MERKGEGFCIWITGLSASGKSTTADMVAKLLRHEYQCQIRHLDGDIVRETVCSDLGFSPEDRRDNINRMIGVASWMVHYTDNVPIASFITPYEELRRKVKMAIPRCLMVELRCPLEICEARDPKGLYKKARSGEIPNFTGIGAPFERVECADLVCYSGNESVERIASQIVAKLRQLEWV